MPDLSPEEREALIELVRDIELNGPALSVNYAVEFVRRALAAVPRLAQPEAERYHELLYAVQTTHPGETRHETALRYIRESEERHWGGKAAFCIDPLPAPPPTDREGMERKPIGWLDAELVDPEPSLRMAVEGLLACTLDESGRDGYRSLYAVDRRRLMWLKRGLERFDGLPLTDFSAFAYRAPPGPTTEEE